MGKIKRTPLHTLHAELGAKFGEYAGFEMPLFYPLGVMKEHLHTRARAGLFDISHMMHIEVEGREAEKVIARACPYDAAAQEIGICRYTFFLNENAGIIDDLIVTRLGTDRFLIVANAGCAEKDIAHIHSIGSDFDCQIRVLPRAFLALQGPEAEEVLNASFDVDSLRFMTAMEPKENWFISRTGYTGEDGFEIALPEEEVEGFARSLLDDDGVQFIGLAARDSLRLEAGLSLYGQDLAEDITPMEAGLTWAIPKSMRAGGDYIGAEALEKAINTGRTRMRVGFKPVGKAPVRAGAPVVSEDGTPVGIITSGGFGPTIDGPVALGLIEVDAKDDKLFAEVRGRNIEMESSRLPFVPHNYKR